MPDKKLNSETTENYSFGYSRGIIDYLTYRAKKSLDFILPYLSPEMNVLECGCGPGAVTFEIAKVVTSGKVVGLDIDKDQIDSNNLKLSGSAIGNMKFETGSVLQLPYPDDTFDVVYMQALIVHIKTPLHAIKETRRVLRKNGLIILREPVMDRAVISPENPVLQESIDLVQRAIHSYGGDASVGRKLLPLLQEAGFTSNNISLSWEQPGSLDQWPVFYEAWANAFRGRMEDIVLKNGWCDKNRIDEFTELWKKLGRDKKGFAASPWGQAVGTKS